DLVFFANAGGFVARADFEQALVGAANAGDGGIGVARELFGRLARLGRRFGDHGGLEFIQALEQEGRSASAVLVARREDHARIHGLADALAGGQYLFGFGGTHLHRLPDHITRRDAVGLILVGVRVVHDEVLQGDPRRVDAMTDQELVDVANVAGHLGVPAR